MDSTPPEAERGMCAGGRVIAALAAILLAGACEPEGPRIAESAKVVENAEDPGALWPVLLQHCLKAPGCDPTSNFGHGAGQSSGAIDYVTYFVEAADTVKEGGRDHGGAVTINLYAPRGDGGAAGRPLTLGEAPDNLRANNARRSTLSIEYRTPGGGPPEPYFLYFRSAQLALSVPGEPPRDHAAMIARTGDHVASMTWPSGEEGAKIEITGKAGVLFADHSIGMESGEPERDSRQPRRSFEPWMFYLSRNLRDEPLPKLMAAIDADETLYVTISAPGGGLMLSDAIRVRGYDAALREGTEALADPELAKPIPERCQRFENELPEFWKVADVSAALRVCDSRTPQQRARDSRSR
jgi:hypothetical protein